MWILNSPHLLLLLLKFPSTSDLFQCLQKYSSGLTYCFEIILLQGSENFSRFISTKKNLTRFYLSLYFMLILFSYYWFLLQVWYLCSHNKNGSMSEAAIKKNKIPTYIPFLILTFESKIIYFFIYKFQEILWYIHTYYCRCKYVLDVLSFSCLLVLVSRFFIYFLEYL